MSLRGESSERAFERGSNDDYLTRNRVGQCNRYLSVHIGDFLKACGFSKFHLHFEEAELVIEAIDETSGKNLTLYRDIYVSRMHFSEIADMVVAHIQKYSHVELPHEPVDDSHGLALEGYLEESRGSLGRTLEATVDAWRMRLREAQVEGTGVHAVRSIAPGLGPLPSDVHILPSLSGPALLEHLEHLGLDPENMYTETVKFAGDIRGALMRILKRGRKSKKPFIAMQEGVDSDGDPFTEVTFYEWAGEEYIDDEDDEDEDSDLGGGIAIADDEFYEEDDVQDVDIEELRTMMETIFTETFWNGAPLEGVIIGIGKQPERWDDFHNEEEWECEFSDYCFDELALGDVRSHIAVLQAKAMLTSVFVSFNTQFVDYPFVTIRVRSRVPSGVWGGKSSRGRFRGRG